MRILVNGEPKDLSGTPTVLDLLTHLGLGERPVAVERNAEIVPRAHHAQTPLAEGDTLEIVQFVGGG